MKYLKAGTSDVSESDPEDATQETQEVMQKQGTVEADARERIEFRDPPQQYDSEEHEGPVASKSSWTTTRSGRISKPPDRLTDITVKGEM